MKTGVLGLIILTACLQGAAAGELAGTWEGTITKGPDTFHAGFDLDVRGDRVTGAAFIQGWGYSRVFDGRVSQDQFEFTVYRQPIGDGPIAKVVFHGELRGTSMTLAMIDGARYETTLHRLESQVTGPISLDAAPKELEGKWTARFVGRIGDRPKMIRHIDFDFHVDGNTLSGMAHIDNWPGDCPISEGKVENGRFAFTATGKSPSSSGIPILWFEGEIHGKQLKLMMHHQIFGRDSGVGLPIDGIRL